MPSFFSTLCKFGYFQEHRLSAVFVIFSFYKFDTNNFCSRSQLGSQKGCLKKIFSSKGIWKWQLLRKYYIFYIFHKKLSLNLISTVFFCAKCSVFFLISTWLQFICKFFWFSLLFHLVITTLTGSSISLFCCGWSILRFFLSFT